MAIRYDKNYNREINRIVHNFNQKRNRAIKRGFTNVPDNVLVSELKSRYQTRTDLNRELEYLKTFSHDRDKLLRKVETEGGVKAVKWQLVYLKNNLKNTKQYLEREYERVEKRVGQYPGERMYLDTIKAKMENLEVNLSEMNQHQFKSALSTVNEFAKSERVKKTQYRGFLVEVELVMDRLGIPNESKNKFFNKFKSLTPSQFLYAYDNNPIIARIYELYFKKDADSDWQFNTTTDDASELVDILMEEADSIVKDAKTNMD